MRDSGTQNSDFRFPLRFFFSVKSLQNHLELAFTSILTKFDFKNNWFLVNQSVTKTKAALLSLSNGMRMELSKYGVDVILFNPGDHPGETPLCFGQSANYEVSCIEQSWRVLSSLLLFFMITYLHVFFVKFMSFVQVVKSVTNVGNVHFL